MTQAKTAETAKPGQPPPQILAIQILFAAIIGAASGLLHIANPARSDFSSFWAAHHVANAYNSVEISAKLGMGHAYFPYPPPFLLITLPLAWTSISQGYFAWVSISAGAIVVSMRRLIAPIVLLVPIVFLSEINGQTSLIIGACLFGAVSLRRQPILAGVLLGLAVCIKPQIVVVLPVAFLAAGFWRVLLSAALSALLISSAATLAYGVGAWSDWLGSLPAWLQVNDAAWARRYLSLPGAWKIVALVLGASASWWSARRGRFELSAFIAVAAALLGSLHAMDYDLAVLAPFAISAALARRWWGIPYGAALLAPPSAWSVLALAVMALLDVVVSSKISDMSAPRLAVHRL